ncbi:MAG: RsmB/NOP family class I SAM-dependent RNA methyltransferase [Betaproteobacteria bacterium]|nr:RsmB/NOP family class I SAM-dependent RNA methyltransferase [Betaproteobacteria bacterium]
MRLNSTLIAHAEAALAALLKFSSPADAVLSRYFRAHSALGQNDRAFIAETCYAALRHLRSLRARIEEAGKAQKQEPERKQKPEPETRRLLLAALFCHRGWNLAQLEPLLRSGDSEWLRAARMLDTASWPAAQRCDFPDWLYEELVPTHGDDLETLAASLNRPAPLDLRVNPLKISREEALQQLEAAGIKAAASPCSPLGIRVAGKPALNRQPLFLEGAIEVQDEGSQLLGFLVAPKRGEMVADFCAGAGGKTLLLGALMRSQGRLYAFDVDQKRLERLKPRLARSGLSNVYPVLLGSERDDRVRRLAGKFDRVLVDAPCSGFGTLRRNPDLKWRQGAGDVAELAQKQTAILEAAARLLKPGGRLVYATCSLLAAENEAVTMAFLAAHPEFSVLPAEEILRGREISLPGSIPQNADGFLRLFPHVHGTDGFFAAVMEKR